MFGGLLAVGFERLGLEQELHAGARKLFRLLCDELYQLARMYDDMKAARKLQELLDRSKNGDHYWVVANAILPDTDPNPDHVGIAKIDRTTVPELADICNLTTKKLFGVFSENMAKEQYVGLAEAIGAECVGYSPLGSLRCRSCCSSPYSCSRLR